MSNQESIIDIIKIADVNSNMIPEKLKTKLDGLETYRDTVLQLNEHLYNIDTVIEKAQENKTIFTKEENRLLVKLGAEMQRKDCAYFRIINP